MMSSAREQRIRQILALSPAITYSCKASGDFGATFVSDNFTTRFGYSTAEFLNQPDFWRNNIHPDDRERIFSEYDKLFVNGYHSHEYRFRKKDGSYLWVHDELQLVCGDDGKPLEIIGSWLDITDRKEAENALYKSNLLFKEFFECNPIPTIISSLDGAVLEVNNAFLKASGFSRDDVIGVVAPDVFWSNPDDRAVMAAAIKEHGYIDNFECTFFDKYKKSRRCLLSSHAMEIEGELRILNTLIDVTDKRKAEDALRKNEKLFRDFFTSNPIPTIITSPDGCIHMVNPTFTATTGYTFEEVVGKTAQELNFWRNLDDRNRMVAAIKEHGYIDNLEAHFYGKNDVPMTCLVSSRSIIHEGETRILSTVFDLTEQRKAAEALRQLEKAKSDFISTAAHELRTPLIAVIGYCELLENAVGMNLTEEQKQEYLGIIMSNAEVLNHLVGDLLDMGRIQIGRSLGVSPKATHLVSLVEKVIASAQLKNENRKFVFKYAKDFPEKIWVDSGRITQVLHNLLNNAIKYSRDDEEVNIELAIKDGKVNLAVIDHGIGMSAEQAERIFEQFYRVDLDNKQSAGLGLGLSIAKQIVVDHGGDIVVESSLNEGTIMTVVLPLKV